MRTTPCILGTLVNSRDTHIGGNINCSQQFCPSIHAQYFREAGTTVSAIQHPADGVSGIRNQSVGNNQHKRYKVHEGDAMPSNLCVLPSLACCLYWTVSLHIAKQKTNRAGVCFPRTSFLGTLIATSSRPVFFPGIALIMPRLASPPRPATLPLSRPLFPTKSK